MNKNNNLSIEDYNKLVADEEQVQLAIIEANKVLLDADIAPLSEYDKYYLEYHTVSCDIKDAVGSDDILIDIAEYKEEIAKLPKHILASEATNISINENFGNSFLEIFAVDYGFFIPYEDGSKVVEGKIKARVLKKIEEALQPSSCNRPWLISCGVLDKFKAGKIDWQTMQEIVYSDCKTGEIK